MIINIMVYFNLPVEGLRDLTLTSVLLFAEIFEFVTEWFQKKIVINKYKNQRSTQRGWAAELQTHSNRNLKTIDFVDTIILNGLRDLSFCRNQPLKLAGDIYIRIKNKFRMS